MSKNLAAKYYQGNTERLQKNLVKDTKIFLKKKKSSNMVGIVIEWEKYRMRKNALFQL